MADGVICWLVCSGSPSLKAVVPLSLSALALATRPAGGAASRGTGTHQEMSYTVGNVLQWNSTIYTVDSAVQCSL